MTRKEYLGDNSNRENPNRDTAKIHRQYYSQFVNDNVKGVVRGTFGVNALKAGNDVHFNHIALAKWDALVRRIPQVSVNGLKEQGDYLTLGTGVCILKEAARQIIETE